VVHPPQLRLAKIERDLPTRDVSTSVADLVRKIRRNIWRYNGETVRWINCNPTNRINRKGDKSGEKSATGGSQEKSEWRYRQVSQRKYVDDPTTVL
jgi:hypothetical protein